MARRASGLYADFMTDRTDWADRTEQAVLDGAIRLAPSLGWSARMVERASAEQGLSKGDAELLFPHGARDLAALLSRRHDARALALLPADPAGLKIREWIAKGVGTRLDVADAERDSTRRWAGFLALPWNADLGLKLAWESADTIWRWAGDTATDENHYSKRAILAGILVPALSIRLSQGRPAAEAFVANRIENVMQFEKWKAGIRPSRTAQEIARVLGEMRYGGR